MNLVTMSVLLQMSMLSAGPSEYGAAYRDAVKNDEALLVLVGADWCPACVNMKRNVMPQVEQSGSLKKVHFARVNVDEQRGLAGKLSQAGMIPQLILYRKGDHGWRRYEVVGGQSPESVKEFLHNGETEQANKGIREVSQR